MLPLWVLILMTYCYHNLILNKDSKLPMPWFPVAVDIVVVIHCCLGPRAGGEDMGDAHVGLQTELMSQAFA